ncbi:SDR family oxidoreductase [Luteipulveratus flavus]|uniref:SDR family NAD(P)-dependent oxidoreductase n=1 Tax=Luteipulveratus flavus TaxID=3031728 RepID=A0ABT6CE84_9MICO|nr:SDR family oxidoreductase [Luteipulveratus sp. YIM 133296]MDF8266349.1 SDR family NAD(P)-dependent oxidoreductase [Luteipulveratus sp. YIM 133296]
MTDASTSGSTNGLVVVVTGAAGAAGPPVVRRLVAGGATVVAVDVDPTKLDAAVAGIEGPGRVETAVVDLLDEPSTLAWGHELVQEHGQVDGLLHLVGGWRGGKGIVESDLADWDALHDSLIRTLQHASRALHDPIKESPRGRLAIVSSVQVDKPSATNASYAAAKAATEVWTRAVADSFEGSQAAATVVRIMALLTPAMQEAKPEAKFKGFTHVDQVAQTLVGLWDKPASEINGAILDGR